MDTIMNLCFLCTNDYDCEPLHENIVSQVEYLLPEITIIKLGVPLHICSVCNGALCAFSKFKQFCVENSRRLEASIKGAQGPSLHTGSPSVVDDNESSAANLEKMEEIFIKKEYVEETPLDTQMHTDRASLNPIYLLETISAEPQNQNMQLHTDTNADNTEEITIKEEPMEETAQDRLHYNKIFKEECVSDSTIDDTDSQPEHKTKDECSTFNTSEEVWEGSYTEFKEETDGNYRKNIHQDELNKKIQENKEHRCNVCTKLFASKLLLTRHMKENHNGIKKFPCSMCKTTFYNNSDLEEHLKLHIPNQIKDPLSCPVCNKKLKSELLVKRHLKNYHNRVKNFQCDACNKSFLTKSELTRHMIIHSEVRDIQCDVCNKSFTQKSSLNVHMKIHTGMKDFQCGVCNKSFTQKSNLSLHMKIHTGVKDFQCGVCNKSYMRKEQLNLHMKIHSGVKDFHCDVCNKSFPRKCELSRHLKIHSRVTDFQ